MPYSAYVHTLSTHGWKLERYEGWVPGSIEFSDCLPQMKGQTTVELPCRWNLLRGSDQKGSFWPGAQMSLLATAVAYCQRSAVLPNCVATYFCRARSNHHVRVSDFSPFHSTTKKITCHFAPELDQVSQRRLSSPWKEAYQS